jgi:hypothetical protein
MSINGRVFLIIIGVAIIAGYVGYTLRGTRPSRQEVVRAKGTQVMPFDLDKTTHIFTPLDDGGLQEVIVKDPNDEKNIAFIHQHLQKEATNFQKGDYSDPAFIHGVSMAGLSDLSQAAEKITVTYSALPNGAQITYVSQDPQVINAIHAWFMAQAMDHGSDALMHE